CLVAVLVCYDRTAVHPFTDLLVLHYFFFFFFFFQAEDGIRDDLVTGVQTCTLPISSAAVSLARVARKSIALRAASAIALLRSLRSEERRVGKSVDLGGRRGSKKKKGELV